jgi:pyruvate,water dikinase
MAPTPGILVDCSTPLEQITPADVGGKGWNLFRLRRAGAPVPRWCVLPAGVFHRALGMQRSRLLAGLSVTDFNSQSAVEEASRQAEKIIRSSFASSRLEDEIEAALARWAVNGSPLAVRSSAPGEDGRDDSFAGLFASSLNVDRMDVPEHILRVWSSAFSPRALVYRRKKGLPPEGIGTAVIIQEMVPARRSGVLFTADPETGGREVIIAAAYGLGEGVVANLVETDTYRIGSTGNRVERTVVRKQTAVGPLNGRGGGTGLTPVGWLRRGRPVLTDREALGLRDLALAVERHFGAAQDIEWACDRSGSPFILQTRPVVFARCARPAPEVRVWDNSNIVESYPGITLPLTFSFISDAYERIFRRAVEGFVRPADRPAIDPSVFAGMLGLVEGRVYYNLMNWYRMLSYLPGFQRYKPAWDRMIGIDTHLEFPSAHLSFLSRAKAAWRIADILFFVGRRARRFDRWFRTAYARHAPWSAGDLTLDEAIGRYRRLVADLEVGWHETLYNDMAAMKYHDWLTRLTSRWIGDAGGALHNDLLRGGEGMESVGPLRSLLRIAEALRRNPAGRDLADRGTEEEAWRRIQSDPSLHEVCALVEAHLAAFGDRAFEELKLESRTFREQPPLLIAMVRQEAGNPRGAENERPRDAAARDRAMAVVRGALGNPLRRAAFALVLRNARRAVTTRENMRFARARVYGIARTLFRRVGALLAAEGLLERSDDVFYLTIPDIIRFAEGTGSGEPLRTLVTLRKGVYASYGDPPPDRFTTTGIPCLASARAVPPAAAGTTRLRGTGCSSGRVSGAVRIVKDPRRLENNVGRILVARSTDPAWVFLMASSLGIIVEKGSVLSHTAIIGRELGIPTIIGVLSATSILREGANVEMDGGTGEIRWD